MFDVARPAASSMGKTQGPLSSTAPGPYLELPSYLDSVHFGDPQGGLPSFMGRLPYTAATSFPPHHGAWDPARPSFEPLARSEAACAHAAAAWGLKAGLTTDEVQTVMLGVEASATLDLRDRTTACATPAATATSSQAGWGRTLTAEEAQALQLQSIEAKLERILAKIDVSSSVEGAFCGGAKPSEAFGAVPFSAGGAQKPTDAGWSSRQTLGLDGEFQCLPANLV